MMKEVGYSDSLQRQTDLQLKSFDEDEVLRLATLAANRKGVFADEIANWDTNMLSSCPLEKKRPMRKKDTNEADTDESEEESDEEEDDSKEDASLQMSHNQFSFTFDYKIYGMEKKKKSTPSRKVHGCDHVEEPLHACTEIRCPVDRGISRWIEKLYCDSRGFEIGTFNPCLLSSLMKKQPARWPTLAEGYISDIITIVHTFIRKALCRVCLRDVELC